jgi:hypothetical protein
MMGDVDMIGRYVSRFSTLMKKGPLPDGAGFNWQSVLYDRTIPTNTVTWTAVQANDGTNGTCVADANPVKSAVFIQNYSAFQTAFKSEDICLLDARYGYLFDQQTENKKTNFQQNIVDAWEQQDRLNYIASSKYKYVAASNLPFTSNSSNFPVIPAIYPASQQMFEVFGRKLDRDGAEKAGGAWAMKDGRAIYLILMSSEVQEQVIKTNDATRQDFRFSDEGMGENAVLRKKFGLDRPYGGFFHMIDDRMPRFNFDADLGYVEVPFFENAPDSIGTQANVSVAYENADYEMVIFWNPNVVQRLMPGDINTVGADTKFGPINYNGDIVWLNFPTDCNPRQTIGYWRADLMAAYRPPTDCNPRQTIGYWRADLMAAYRPQMTRYGYCLMVNRCRSTLYNFLPCS